MDIQEIVNELRIEIGGDTPELSTTFAGPIVAANPGLNRERLKEVIRSRYMELAMKTDDPLEDFFPCQDP